MKPGKFLLYSSILLALTCLAGCTGTLHVCESRGARYYNFTELPDGNLQYDSVPVPNDAVIVQTVVRSIHWPLISSPSIVGDVARTKLSVISGSVPSRPEVKKIVFHYDHNGGWLKSLSKKDTVNVIFKPNGDFFRVEDTYPEPDTTNTGY